MTRGEYTTWLAEIELCTAYSNLDELDKRLRDNEDPHAADLREEIKKRRRVLRLSKTWQFGEQS